MAEQARPQEKLEVVLDQYAATNERDFSRAMSHYDEDVELVASGPWLRSGVFKGREAVGAWFGDWFSTFDRDARFDVKEARELEDGSVLIVADHHARGRASGAEARITVVWVYRLRAGKITRVEGFDSQEEALAPAGSSAMSQQNGALAHRLIDAFNQRDLDSYLALCDPGVEYFSRIVELEGGGPFLGHDGIRTWWESLLAISRDMTVEVDEMRDLGEVVVMRLRVSGHGLESDVPMEQTQWHATKWRHGRVVWGHACRSEAGALEAAGLRE